MINGNQQEIDWEYKMKKLRIGTRGSALALKQAKMLEEALSVFPEMKTEIVVSKKRIGLTMKRPKDAQNS